MINSWEIGPKRERHLGNLRRQKSTNNKNMLCRSKNSGRITQLHNLDPRLSQLGPLLKRETHERYLGNGVALSRSWQYFLQPHTQMSGKLYIGEGGGEGGGHYTIYC